MATYESDLAKIVAGRQDLANAEKLLDLPVTVYPEVINIQRDMRGLRQIYDIFKAQKVRCRNLNSRLGHIIVMIMVFMHVIFILKPSRMQRKSGLRFCGWI